MSIEIIDKLKQKNNGTFKLIDLEDVDYDGTGTSTKDKIEELVDNQITLEKDDTSFDGVDDTIHDNLTTTDKRIIGAINEVNSQYKDIVNKTITNEERTKLNSLKNYDDTSIKNDIQTQKARIDSLSTLKEGSTTGDAELIDGRIGADNYIYNNVGNAIRENIKYIIERTSNLFNKQTAKKGYYINAISGAEKTVSLTGDWWATDFMYVENIDTIYLSELRSYGFYTKDKEKVDSGGSAVNAIYNTSLSVPVGAYYFRTTVKDSIDNFIVTSNSNMEHEPYMRFTNDMILQIKEIITNNSITTINDIMKSIILSDKTINIKLIGDSITAGVGGTGYELTGETIYGNFKVNEHGKCWANSLKLYFESKFNCTVKNFGCSGINSQHIIDNWASLVKEADDIVICMIGTNDRSQRTILEFYNNIVKIYNLAKESNKKIIFMANIPTNVSNESNSARIFHMEDIDNIVSKFAYENNIEYISVYKLFNQYCKMTGKTINSLLKDGVHPNDEGYDVMFYLICNALGITTKIDGATW